MLFVLEYIDDVECSETLSERAKSIQQPSAKRGEFLSKVGLPILGLLTAKITTDIWANPRKVYFRGMFAILCAY